MPPTTSNVDTVSNGTSWAEQIVDNPILVYMLKIGGGILVILLLLLLSKIVSSLVQRSFLRHSTDENLESTRKVAKLVSSIVFYVLVLMSFFIGFEVMGFNIGLLIGGVSFGLGLAFKELLGNMFAGMMILYTKELKIGDIIEIQTDQGYFGRIEEISIRYTVIRTLDLRQVVVPNITLITVPIKTFSSEELIRLDTTIGVHYDTDLSKAIETIKDCINSFDFVQEKKNTKVFVINFGDSSIDLKCMFYYDPKKGLIAEVAIGYIHEKINEAFGDKGIVIPYKQTTLTFESEKDRKILSQKLTDNLAKESSSTI